MRGLFSLLCGVVFGLGLALSGMTDTQKVIGFLDLFGNWVPDLMFVMGGALIVTAISFWLIFKLKKPFCDSKFYLPQKRALDKKLIIGALVFGIGWGLYGYCPGPAIASIAYLDASSFGFITAMFVGMLISHKLKNRKI